MDFSILELWAVSPVGFFHNYSGYYDHLLFPVFRISRPSVWGSAIFGPVFTWSPKSNFADCLFVPRAILQNLLFGMRIGEWNFSHSEIDLLEQQNLRFYELSWCLFRTVRFLRATSTTTGCLWWGKTLSGFPSRTLSSSNKLLIVSSIRCFCDTFGCSMWHQSRTIALIEIIGMAEIRDCIHWRKEKIKAVRYCAWYYAREWPLILGTIA